MGAARHLPPGITLPLHFHTGTVHIYTMSGCWYYTKYPEQKQTAGCYLYEPGGSIHQLKTPTSNTEDTDTFMVVSGTNINFLEDGTFLDVMDAGMIKAWVDQAIKDQGRNNMKYVAATGPTYSVNPHPRVASGWVEFREPQVVGESSLARLRVPQLNDSTSVRAAFEIVPYRNLR